MFLNKRNIIFQFLLGLLFLVINFTPIFAGQLTVQSYGYLGKEFNDKAQWFSFTLTDSSLNPVTGLTAQDIQIQEAILDQGGQTVSGQRAVALQAQMNDEYSEAGFWEQSVSDKKMDIVFILQEGYSGEAITVEIRQYLERLKSSHVDFRVAAMIVGDTPIVDNTIPDGPYTFYNSMETDRFFHDLDAYSSGGPPQFAAFTYDAILAGPFFGFRDDAEKIAIVITDTVPVTIYGTYWGDSTAATMSAIEALVKKTGLTIYFSQPDDVYSSICDWEYYYRPDINPKAGDDESGFTALEEKGLATRLSWPFSQEGLPCPTRSIVDSRYYVAWDTSFSMSDIKNDNYRLQVTVSVGDPDNPGGFLTREYTLPPENACTDLDIHAENAIGEAYPYYQAQADLYSVIGNRLVSYEWESTDDNGLISFEGLPVGSYFLQVDTGDPSVLLYDYYKLASVYTQWIEVPEGGDTLTIRVPTALKNGEIAKARGLIKDLDDWDRHAPGDPFRGFANEANRWMDSLEEEPIISYRDMTGLKSFSTVLSGMANLTEYSSSETVQAIDAFQHIIADFRDVIQRVNDIESSTEQDFKSVLEEVGLDILTMGEFTVAKEAVEQALQQLMDYASHQLISELKDVVKSNIPSGPYKPLMNLMVDSLIDRDFDNWDALNDMIHQLSIDGALDNLRYMLSEGFAEALFTNISLDTPLKQDLVGKIQNVVEALAGSGFNNFEDTMSALSKALAPYVQQYGREAVVDAIDSIFEQAMNSLPSGWIRDFMLAMTRDFSKLATPFLENGSVSYQFDDDTAVNILVSYCLYEVVLKDYYVNKVTPELYQALYHAKHMNFIEQDEDDMEAQMASDFCDYYDIVDSLQGPAWNALGAQEDVNGWAESLQGLTGVLDVLSEALHAIGTFYSDFEDIADNVDKFIATLDAVEIVPRSIEFGLRIDSLSTFGNQAQPLRKTIFPDGTSDVTRIDISPATYDFGSVPLGKYSQAVKVTLWNTGNVDIPISSVYLTDPRSFEIVQGLDESVISAGRHADLLVRFRPSGPGAFYDTGLGVTSTIAGLEVQEVQLSGNNLRIIIDGYPITPQTPVDLTITVDPTTTPVSVTQGMVSLQPRLRIQDCNDVDSAIAYVYIPSVNFGVLIPAAVTSCAAGVATIKIASGTIDFTGYPGVYYIYYGYTDGGGNIYYNAYALTVQ